ncbi:MAG: molybdopterin oxidoreductase family protein [Alphaproteobacteria bacterium]|nr:molybdopterin oxidoreductase family protein [Alphaproteobacteria bacterium]
MPDDARYREYRNSACPHDCPSTCALEVERVDAHRIGKVRGAAANGYTAGVICAKVSRYAERVHHPDRLTRPLKRVGDKGQGRSAFVEIGWDEALDRTAEAMTLAAGKHGKEAVWPYYYAGTMGLVQRDGIERLRHAMGYSRFHSTICNTLSDAGWFAGNGAKWGADPREMAEADLIVVWGGNPVATQVNVMTHIARARKSRGARLVVVDPYRTGTAEQADVHLCLRPGTDGALACAVMHVLFTEGMVDRDYLRRYTKDADRLERHLATRTPEWAAGITGLKVDEIVSFARLYGGTRRAYLRLGYGFSRSRNGAAQMFAASCLPAVTGAWQHRGGGALYGMSGIYRIDKTLIEGLDVVDKSKRLLDQSRIGPILTGDKRDLRDGPPVTALFIQNTNPAVVCPESLKVREGFLRKDLFVCVHEQFMTDTAAMADVVLPATTFLEHDDIYQAGGHTHLQVTRKVIEPVGEARSNHDVLCALAQRLGAQHPGFEMSAWEMIDRTLKASGLPDAETAHRMGWIDLSPDYRTAHFLDGFGYEDRRFHFAPDWKRWGLDHAKMPELPDHMATIDAADAEHPFRLVTAPARQFLNTSFTETPGSRAREVRPTAKIHPDDCAALGLIADSLVRIGNRRGSVVVHVEPFDGLQRGVVVVESIWPNGAFREGIGINVLVSADAAPPKGGAVFHDTAVWLKPTN